jgi:hypothetical protein
MYYEDDIDDVETGAWDQYTHALARAGGCIEFTQTLQDKTHRIMDLPWPLATARSLERSLRKDQECLPLADKAVETAAPADVAARAWMSLAKCPNMGETDRLKMADDIQKLLEELSRNDHPVDKIRAALKQMREDGLMDADPEERDGDHLWDEDD